jgi:hypothetical protein
MRLYPAREQAAVPHLPPSPTRGIDRTRAMCGSAPTRRATACFNEGLNQPTEIHMYIGSGILGTILIIALIVYLLRRA